MEPSYYISANGPKTSMRIMLPIFAVPELTNAVKASAFATAAHLKRHGWKNVKVLVKG